MCELGDDTQSWEQPGKEKKRRLCQWVKRHHFMLLCETAEDVRAKQTWRGSGHWLWSLHPPCSPPLRSWSFPCLPPPSCLRTSRHIAANCPDCASIWRRTALGIRQTLSLNRISSACSLVGLTCRWSPLCRTPWGTNKWLPRSLLRVWNNQNTNRLEIPTSRDFCMSRWSANVPSERHPPHLTLIQSEKYSTARKLKITTLRRSDSAFFIAFLLDPALLWPTASVYQPQNTTQDCGAHCPERIQHFTNHVYCDLSSTGTHFTILHYTDL